MNVRQGLVIIAVPDEEIVANEPGHQNYSLPPEVETMAREMQERLAKIRNAPLPNDEDLPPLTQKQLDRIEAVAYRDEIRKGR
jgi:hypothetical protein